MAERITGYTGLAGLFAHPVHHSSSPMMHNEAFAKLGLDYAYLGFDVDNDNLEDAIKAMRTFKMIGANVSMPNKTLVGQYLDEISPAAKLCGAINTIVNQDGKLIGHITDGIGFMQSLEDNNVDIIGKKMTIGGAGGAATAIMVQAALDGVKEISVFNVKDKFFDQAAKKIAEINEKTDCQIALYDLADLDRLKQEIASSQLFVNATGVGMKPLEGKTYIPDVSYLPKDVFVVDIIYAPEETALLKLAKEAGCKYMNGKAMVLFQGAASFKLWTGQDMPIDYMKKILNID